MEHNSEQAYGLVHTSNIVWQKAVPCERSKPHPCLGIPILQSISMQAPIFAEKSPPPPLTDDIQCYRRYLQEVVVFLQHFSEELPQTIHEAIEVYNTLVVMNKSPRWAKAAKKNNSYGVTPPAPKMSEDDFYIQDNFEDLKSLIRTSLSNVKMTCRLTKRPDMEKFVLWPESAKAFETNETGTAFMDEEKAKGSLNEFAGLFKLAPSAVCICYHLVRPDDSTNVDDERTRSRDKAAKTLQLIMREVVVRNVHPTLLTAQVSEYQGGDGDVDLILVDLSPHLKPPPAEENDGTEWENDSSMEDGESYPVEWLTAENESSMKDGESHPVESLTAELETGLGVLANVANVAYKEVSKNAFPSSVNPLSCLRGKMEDGESPPVEEKSGDQENTKETAEDVTAEQRRLLRQSRRFNDGLGHVPLI